ncbi:bile acid:sodium symporter family protein [Crocosphaera chwakensis]|uniref:Possible sodium dependent transporter n=1 Tax=Crocosphaera chwakensis CCY0110 TaxID=391612 RepID=A3IT16_9CHRO|nr:sodium-dependent transporter [Crocosphaera chwakensis]EAZ90320.1 possible sodium dependent transporter [Crocosphaera chwakensis CCY0110]
MISSSFFAIFVKTTLFTLMLAIGVNFSKEKLIFLWRDPNKLLRSLLAVIVLVPLIVILLLSVLKLPPESATVLALLAASPGAPLTTKRSEMAGVNTPYSTSLQLTLAILAVIITPLTLTIFDSIFDLPIQVRAIEVAKQVIQVQFLPIGIGVLFKKIQPQLTEKIAKPLSILANILFIVMVLCILPVAVSFIFKMDILSVIAIVVTAIAALVIGYFLGGHNLHERSALAISSIARNIGLVLFILLLNGVAKPFIPALISYTILGAMIAFPYSVWSKGKLAKLPSNSLN